MQIILDGMLHHKYLVRRSTIYYVTGMSTGTLKILHYIINMTVKIAAFKFMQ